VFAQRPAVAPPAQPNLGLLPWFYAAGAILFLFDAARGAAFLASPGGRSQLLAGLARQGVDASMQQGFLTVYWLVLVGFVAAAAVHGAAFYGLRRLRLWGWISALVVAIVWSLLIVGIPVLVRLVSRDVRRAFGVD